MSKLREMKVFLQAYKGSEEVVTVSIPRRYPCKDLMGFAGWLFEQGCEVILTLPHAIVAKRVGENVYYARL